MTGKKCYSGQEQHTLNQLSQHFFGLTLVESYTKPLEYTGELIGISYLYSQTGRTLQDFPDDPEEPDSSEELNVEEEKEDLVLEEVGDEGFHEFLLDVLHPSQQPPQPPPRPTLQQPQRPPPRPTLQQPQPPPRLTLQQPQRPPPRPTLQPVSPQQQPPPVPSSQLTTASSSTYSDPDGRPGYQHVVLLADRLVELCRKGFISDAEAEEIVGLWQNLPAADKGPAVYPSCYRAQLSKGRFKRSKTYAPNAVAMPELESMKRCVVGTGVGPATWPDTRWLVEAIFIRLTVLHPSGKRMMGCLVSRWTLILRDYNTIRNVVTMHPALRNRTTLQLPPSLSGTKGGRLPKRGAPLPLHSSPCRPLLWLRAPYCQQERTRKRRPSLPWAPQFMRTCCRWREMRRMRRPVLAYLGLLLQLPPPLPLLPLLWPPPLQLRLHLLFQKPLPGTGRGCRRHRQRQQSKDRL
ncbi:uncharacterized protein LOC125889050 [Epinephelus fuscoguttatus]|uniref:uncharacterized protein LOC125889050 n=1 Tax=Epinephelus fuscoguttatus TaxID=293821 RepID=UPI0020D02C62|nr:uncharacterized protein LOC125889050 [Epinephelus fuscoguttatus]